MKQANYNLKESAFLESGYTVNHRKTNSFYTDIFGLTLEKEEKRIYSTFLMTDNRVKYEGNYYTKYNNIEIENNNLSRNQISISKNISKKYSLKVDDEIIFNMNFKDYNYTVKYIFDDFYGFNDTNILGPENLIILGYNEDIIKNSHYYEIYYFSNEIPSNVTRDLFFKENGIKINNRLMLIYNILSVIVITVVFIVVGLIYRGKLEKDLNILRYYGYSKRMLIKYILQDSFYKYLLSFVISFIFVAIFNIYKGISILNNFIVYFGTLFVILLYVIITRIKKLRRIIK